MAFPWKVISSVDLASGSVVEDLQLTIDLTKAGREPIFVSDARIWSHAAGETATLVQRTRWEGGFLATARQSALPLLYEGLRRCRWPEFWLAIHLLTPPLALLIALNLLAALLMGTLSIYLSDWVHVACVSVLQLGTAGSLLGSWLVGGKAYLPLAGILKLPAYVLWKIPMYARVFRGQKISWKRTER
jgi:cellulose synthase/poly-beta-1,6-N-acetylglucosamine synthase-like glycosyltransferase